MRSSPPTARLGVGPEVRRILRSTDRHSFGGVIAFLLHAPYYATWAEGAIAYRDQNRCPIAAPKQAIRWVQQTLSFLHAGGKFDPDAALEVFALVPGQQWTEGYSRRADPRQLATRDRLLRNHALIAQLVRSGDIATNDLEVFLKDKVALASDRHIIEQALRAGNLTARGRFRVDDFVGFIEKHGLNLSERHTLDLVKLVDEKLAEEEGAGTPVISLPRRVHVVTEREAPEMTGPEVAVVAACVESIVGMHRVLRMMCEHYGWNQPNRLPADLAAMIATVAWKRGPGPVHVCELGKKGLMRRLGNARKNEGSVWELTNTRPVDNGRGKADYERIDEARARGIIEEYFSRVSFEQALSDVNSPELGREKPQKEKNPTSLKQLLKRRDKMREGVVVHSIMLDHCNAELVTIEAEIAALTQGRASNKKHKKKADKAS